MIILLMNKTVRFNWSVIFLCCMCNLKNVFSEDPVPVNLNYKGKYTSDIKNYEIVVPQRVNQDGRFISHLVSHRHSKRSTKELEFIFYKIPIEGNDYLIELMPNKKLISPGAVVEIHKENIGNFTNQKFINESSKNETIGTMFRNLDIKKLKNTDCHFSGTVKGENISKAALSTCYGLAGFIQITKGFYTIEPVAEHDPFVEDAYPHILYKSDGLDNSSVCHTMEEMAMSLIDQLVRKRRESSLGMSSPTFVETLIVMDKSLIDHHRDSDCENYVLTVFNMASNLFHDASSGLMMTLSIVRIIRLEVEDDEMNLGVNSDAEKTLKSFQNWQYLINPGDDSHPNHHDVAVFLTRVNICFSPSSCGLLGLTTIGKGCDPKLSAALCEDSGLRLGYIIAHEMGHLLGADHDSEKSKCNGTDAGGLQTVMHPHVSLTTQTWSTCSQAYFKAFFSSGLGQCFFDEPEEHHFNVQDLLPGVMYNADYQCKQLLSSDSRECEMGSTCESLNCYVPGYACIVTHTPPADGTHCGENMWCRDTKCLVVGERPGAIDGNWGEWSAWSDCSRTCGSGVASSERHCNKPQPSHGGRNCIGERKRYKICAATPCETGRPSFRDIQCGEFDDWIYPEDGKVHTWKGYYSHDENPCTLFCINENKQVAALRPRVVDGTMCYRGIHDICIGGICKSLPCDLHFESNSVEDACGICHGDGTGCEFSEGIETFSKLTKGLTKLINVPSGTRNIKVEEMFPTSAKIVVRDKDTRDIYIRGKSLGMFNVPGSQAWLGMIKKDQEALNIPGPVSKPLTIWIQRSDNVTIKWSMALPVETQRKPEFAWDFLKWGPCSAKCGPGTQKTEPSCMEGKAGLVEDIFCADLEEPPVKVRQCEIAPCVPRWMVGDWKGCEPHTQKKERKRVVYCIKPIGEGDGESQIVSDSECEDPKPHDEEPCEIRKKREDTEYSYEGGDGPSFKSDTSEFGFHKKYDDYLKHFAALSVPQRNSETIPLYLVSSPHFKHYFHVLETPDDSEMNSGADVSLPNATSYETEAQSKISPDFYKETFSGQQIGVSHIQALSQEGGGSGSSLENRTKKSLNWDTKQRQGRSANFRLRKSPKRSKSGGKSKLKFSKKQKRSEGFKKFFPWHAKKTFNYTSPNLMTFVENFNQKKNSKEKSRVTNSVTEEKFNKISSPERVQLMNYQEAAYSPENVSQRKSSFFSLFSKNKKDQVKFEQFQNNAMRAMKSIPNKDFDGSGLKRLPLPDEIKDFDARKLIQDEKNSLENPFDPKNNTVRFFKGIENLSEQKRKNLWGKKRKRTLKRMYKRKRSSRIWKKPKSKDASAKSGREQNPNASGTEGKNYLNNLFPKAANAKPTQANNVQETKPLLEKPVIKEGVLVIDRDSADDREMELIFEDDEAEEKRQQFIKLPQPSHNERKLTIKGQDVFNLFEKLQERSGHEGFYRSGDKTPQDKMEINIKIPDKDSTNTESTTNATTTTTVATTTTTVATTAATTATSTAATTTMTATETTVKKDESTTQQTKETESTIKTTPKKTEQQTQTTGVNKSTTTEVISTADSKPEDDSDGCEFEIDEVITKESKPEDKTDNEDKKKDKKMKKKKKKKKKKDEKKSKSGDRFTGNFRKEIEKYDRIKTARWYYGL